MAKLSAHGTEIGRYLSDRHRGLMAVMSDGKVLRRTPYSGWKRCLKLKPGVDPAAFYARKCDSLPAWMTSVRTIPSLQTMERWLNEDGMCESVSGDCVEPDGTGRDGSPSWLRFFGLI